MTYLKTHHYGIRLENKKKHTETLGIVGNLAETSTAYLNRYDPNNSVNTAIRMGQQDRGSIPGRGDIYARHRAQNGCGIQAVTYHCAFHGGKATRVSPYTQTPVWWRSLRKAGFTKRTRLRVDNSVTSSTSVDRLGYNNLIGTRYWCPCYRTARLITCTYSNSYYSLISIMKQANSKMHYNHCTVSRTTPTRFTFMSLSLSYILW